MEAHHAAMGRRKLEEIRQKKAAERATGFGIADSTFSGNTGGSNLVEELLKANLVVGRDTNTSDSDKFKKIQNLEGELFSLQSQLRRVEDELQQQQERNAILSSKLHTVETDRNSLEQQIKDLEASKRRSLESLSMEKDAAVVAREDLVTQIRALKKRLREVEEEQYKAEEDAAFLRAELEALHHREEKGSLVLNSFFTPEQFRAMEQEVDALKVELQKVLHQVQNEQQKLDSERHKVAELTSEKEWLKKELIEVSHKIPGNDMISSLGQNAGGVLPNDMSKNGESSSLISFTVKTKASGKHEQQLRELASMVERLESGRQKLLTEVDVQSLEIERLFIENSSLVAGIKDAAMAEMQLEKHVQACLEENAGLRALLNELRMENAQAAGLLKPDNCTGDGQSGQDSNMEIRVVSVEENSKLKVELANAQGHAEALKAQVLQLSVNLNLALKKMNSLSMLYRPVLANIENRLLQLKQDSHFSNDVFY